MNNTPARCVIFDCEGTLVDSERLCCQALVNVFSQFGHSYTFEQALSHFEGGKLADILTNASEHMGLSISLDALEPLYRTELKLLFDQHLEPMDGASNALDWLSNEGIEFCVASNSPREKIENALKLTGLLHYFEGKVFSAFDTNSWKPEPDLIRYSAMNMGFELKDCLYVDDTAKGLEAGVRAGVRTVQLVGVHSRLYSGEVAKISHLLDLQTLINDESSCLSES